MDNRQENALKALGLTPTEIAEVAKADQEIDRGAKLFELPEELKAGAKKARQADRKQTAPTKRERKENPDKREIIQTIDDALCDLADNVEVVNPERELLFMYNGIKYKVVLSAPRS